MDLTKAWKASIQYFTKVQRVSDGLVASCDCNGSLKVIFRSLASHHQTVTIGCTIWHGWQVYCSVVHQTLYWDSRFEKPVHGRLRIIKIQHDYTWYVTQLHTHTHYTPHTLTHTLTHARTNTHHTLTHAHAHTHSRAHTHTHTHTHKYTHTQTHTYSDSISCVSKLQFGCFWTGYLVTASLSSVLLLSEYYLSLGWYIGELNFTAAAMC